jgi:hypothetical protein
VKLSLPPPTSYLGWAARISSLFSLVLLALFFFAAADDRTLRLEWAERLLFFFFPIGLAVGMIIGWWSPRLGGIVAVLSLVMFYGIETAQSGSPPRGIYFALIALPGFIFLASSFCNRRGKPE